MKFLDKLELMLFETSDIYCTTYSSRNYSNSLILEVNAHEVNCCKSRQSYIRQGINEMISYLKDPIKNKPVKYTHFYLNTTPNSILNKINDLNPTDEDLVNLYKHVAHGFTFFKFSSLLKNKESIINIIKLGHDYTYNWENRVDEYFKKCLSFLKSYGLSEDEMIEVIYHYIKNSKNIIEAEGEKYLIGLCIFFIKDKNKCKKLIREALNQEVDIQDNFIEKKVLKLEMDDSFFIKKYGFIHPKNIQNFLIMFQKHVSNNSILFNSVLNLDYYKTNKHNLIIESNSDNINELKEILDIYFEYYISTIKDYPLPTDFFKHLDNSPDIFKKMILNIILKQDLIKQEEKIKRIIKV